MTLHGSDQSDIVSVLPFYIVNDNQTLPFREDPRSSLNKVNSRLICVISD